MKAARNRYAAEIPVRYGTGTGDRIIPFRDPLRIANRIADVKPPKSREGAFWIRSDFYLCIGEELNPTKGRSVIGTWHATSGIPWFRSKTVLGSTTLLGPLQPPDRFGGAGDRAGCILRPPKPPKRSCPEGLAQCLAMSMCSSICDYRQICNGAISSRRLCLPSAGTTTAAWLSVDGSVWIRLSPSLLGNSL